MKTILRLVAKDFVRFLKDKPAVSFSFIVPIVLILIFGYVFGGDGGPRGRPNIILVNESNSLLAKLIEQKLDSSSTLRSIKFYTIEGSEKKNKFDEPTAMRWVKEGKISAAVVMPKEFFTDTSSTMKFKFYYDPKNEIESSIIQGNIQQIIMAQASRVLPVLLQRKALNFLGTDSTKQFIHSIGTVTQKFFDMPVDSFVDRVTRIDSARLFANSGDSKNSSEIDENNFASNLVKFESHQLVGVKIVNPQVTRIAGGWAVMFLLFSLTGAATSLFDEKQEGTMKRLLCMPVTRSQILWSKYIYTLVLGIVQMLVIFFFSWIFFRVDIFSNFGNLLVVIIAATSAAVAFGMLITSFAKSLNQASSYSTLIILVMSAIGGSWFPTSMLPDWMQILSKGTLTYWSVEAFLQVLWRQSSFIGILPNVLILLVLALAVNTYSLIRFNKGNIF